MNFNKMKVIDFLDRIIKGGLFFWVFSIPISIGAMNTLAAFLFLLFFVNIILGKRYNFFDNKISKSILLFSSFILISSIWAFNYFIVIDEFVSSTMSYLLMYFLVINIIEEDDIKRILVFYWISTFIASGFAGYQHFILDIKRATGFTHNPNRLGASMMMFIIFNFSILLFSKIKYTKMVSALGLIFGFAGLFSSLSRSSLISTIIALFVISIIKNKKNIYIYLTLMLLLFLVLPEDYKLRLIQLSDLQSHNVNQRLLMYKSGIKIFFDNFLLGIGFNNVELIYKYYDLSQITYNHVHLHNIFINFAVELGLLGMSGLIYLLYKVLEINVLSIMQKSSFLNIGVLGIILAQFSYNMVDANFHAPEVALIFVFFVSIMIKQFDLLKTKSISNVGGI